jgi:hypothetical protein
LREKYHEMRENVGIFKNKTFMYVFYWKRDINQQKCNKHYTDMTLVLNDAVAKKIKNFTFSWRHFL